MFESRDFATTRPNRRVCLFSFNFDSIFPFPTVEIISSRHKRYKGEIVVLDAGKHLQPESHGNR